jgi:hypothetical protein
VDHEAAGCRSDEVKGIAGNQREGRAARRLQHREIVRLDDRVAGHAILEYPLLRFDPDFISDLNPSQRPEERIAMACQRRVPFLPWKRCVREMSYREVQRATIVTHDNDRGQAETRNLETSD